MRVRCINRGLEEREYIIDQVRTVPKLAPLVIRGSGEAVRNERRKATLAAGRLQGTLRQDTE